LVASVSKRSGGFAARHPISDGSAFNELKKLVDSEGANLAGPDWLGMLAAIGIIKASPSHRMRAAARSSIRPRRPVTRRAASSVFKKSSVAAPFASIQTSPGGHLDLDARIWMFTDYYSASPGMVSQNPGKGAMYVIGFTDNEGAPLVGGSNYRLSLPASSPPPTSGR
jgi:hypothetical protein